MKNNDDKILVRSVYLFYDRIKNKLIGIQSKEYPGIPFIISPSPTTESERLTYTMYPTNNLYYIISNGGVELTTMQAISLLKVRDKVIGETHISRITNADTAKLTREEIHSLITQLNVHISKNQLEKIEKSQQEYEERLI